MMNSHALLNPSHRHPETELMPLGKEFGSQQVYSQRNAVSGARRGSEVIFRRRHRGWANAYPGTWEEPVGISSIPAPLRYLDERHYEVFKMGDIMREVEGPGGSSQVQT